MSFKIGIVGGGFVGGTCFKVFSQLANSDVRLYDKDPKRCKNTIEEVAECEFVFVAVPTPMNVDTGECHTNIVEKVCAEIRKHSKDCIIVLKSTIPPGTTERINFNNGNVLFSPEFLTEASPYEDFCNLGYQIIGVPDLESTNLADRLALVFYSCHDQGIISSQRVYTVASRMAEMVKYTRNTYLATRLSFFNEINQICEKLELPYDILKFYAGLDPRVGNHYNKIDKQNQGFGGHCLPKDLSALIHSSQKLKVDPVVLKSVRARNDMVRNTRDWEEMQDRAVIKKKEGIPVCPTELEKTSE